jgi:tetratricopeptide (TPR) repeat protein
MRLKSLLSIGLVVVMMAGSALAEDDTSRRAGQMIQNGNYDGAIALLNEALGKDPDNAMALTTLASAYHSKGDYEAAIEANRRAAATSWAAPTARYNEACALSLLGRTEEAYKALQQAMDAGFLDYDLIATDSDLDNMRKEHTIDMPPEHKYTDFKGNNGVEMGYTVITPEGYDANQTYPAAFIFAAGNGVHSADWAIENLAGPGDTHEWIVVYPVAPDRGWYTHPSHHALEDMLDEIRESYKIEGNKFHLAGYASGARTASTYSEMSRAYFLTLTMFTPWHWNRWDENEIAKGFDLPVRLVVGRKDELGYDMNARVVKLIGGEDVVLEVVETDDHTLASIRNGRLLDYIPYESTARAEN